MDINIFEIELMLSFKFHITFKISISFCDLVRVLQISVRDL
jgi:hypothetical protein